MIFKFNLTQAQDTSAIVMSTTLLMLAMHPIVQQKVFNEISELIVTKDRNINKVLPSLKYLEMVLNEVMRLFAEVPFILRKSSDNLVLNGLTIPNGVTLLIPILNIHRDEEIWGDDANIFRPERFENLSKIQRSAFMPFTSKFLLLLNCFLGF